MSDENIDMDNTNDDVVPETLTKQKKKKNVGKVINKLLQKDLKNQV